MIKCIMKGCTMNTTLQLKCDLFIRNKKIISSVFKHNPTLIILACASLVTNSNKNVSPTELKKCEKIIKDNTSVFSEFRANLLLPLICKMLLSENPKEYFINVRTTYTQLNSSKLIGDDHKIMASMVICDHKGCLSTEDCVRRTNIIYSRMKKNHKWLTSNEDFPLAAILAVSDIDIDKQFIEIEKNFSILKSKFNDKNAVQSLSHILAIDNLLVENKCQKLQDIYCLLKTQGHPFGTGYELPSLGTLTMLNLTPEQITSLIIQADDYLKKEKGFGNFALGSKPRRLFAAQIVADTFLLNSREDVLLSNVLSCVLSFEICMIVVISSCFYTRTIN